jgi:hypothetical protein
MIYVARQLGRDARLTLSRYRHVIDEFDEQPRIDAETAIQGGSCSLSVPRAQIDAAAVKSRKPEDRAAPRLSWEWSEMRPNRGSFGTSGPFSRLA